jgi:RecB family exonuclease
VCDVTPTYPRTVADALPKVTPSLLRTADSGCARRLGREFEDPDGSSSPVNRARVREAFLDAARTAHAELRAPTPEHFRVPSHLVGEEQAVFAQAARWYLQVFGSRPALVHLHDCDRPTLSRSRRLRIGGWVDLTVVDERGRKELRQLELWGGRQRGPDPLDHGAVKVAVLRLARWAGPDPLLVTWADLVGGASCERVVDVAAELPALRTWFDARVDLIRERVDDPDVAPGLACGSCKFVAGCPAHPNGANRMSPRNDIRPGIISLTPSSLERWNRCRRAWRNRDLLSVPASDESGSPDHGLFVHKMLHLVHSSGSCRDAALVNDVLAAHGAVGDREIGGYLERHARRCPADAEVVGHELEAARFHHRPLPLFMGSARLDAVWAHDGILDVRDYKTGRPWFEIVGQDPVAQLQAWVVAPIARARGLRVRVRYEQLAPETTEDPDPYEPDADDLAEVEEQLCGVAAAMLSEIEFRGVGERDVCGHCEYRSICPDSAAPAQPVWPVVDDR